MRRPLRRGTSTASGFHVKKGSMTSEFTVMAACGESQLPSSKRVGPWKPYLNIQHIHCLCKSRICKSRRLEKILVSLFTHHHTLLLLRDISNPESTALSLVDVVDNDLVLDVIDKPAFLRGPTGRRAMQRVQIRVSCLVESAWQRTRKLLTVRNGGGSWNSLDVRLEIRHEPHSDSVRAKAQCTR
jgi:hypothetical protein